MGDLTTIKNLGVDYEFIEGRVGKALNCLKFCLFEDNNHSTPIGAEFAISAWIDNNARLRFAGSSNDGTYNYFLDIRADIGGDPSARFYLTSSSLYYTSSYSFTYSSDRRNSAAVSRNADGALHHLVIQRKYEETDAITEFYLDKGLIGRQTDANSLFVGRESNLTQMELLVDPVGGRNSAVDNLRIYHRALSAEDISVLFDENS